MAWTTPPTLTDGTVLTGAHTQIWRDDLNETAPAKATTAGSFFAATGTNVIAERIPQAANVATGQTTSTTATYGDLATVGPAVTCTTGTTAAVIIASQIENSTSGGGGNMSFTVGGASSIAASDDRGIRKISAAVSERERFGAVIFQTGLTAGSNIFTARYTTPTGGTATFQNRHLAVIPF